MEVGLRGLDRLGRVLLIGLFLLCIGGESLGERRRGQRRGGAPLLRVTPMNGAPHLSWLPFSFPAIGQHPRGVVSGDRLEPVQLSGGLDLG